MPVRIILLVLFGGMVLMGQTSRKVALEDIFASQELKEKKVENIQWKPDGSAFTFTRKNTQTGLLNIYKHDIKSGREIPVIMGDKLRWKGKPVELSEYQWSPGWDMLLVAGPKKQIWRHSRQAPYFLYHLESRRLISLANGDPTLQNVYLSPDGKWVAYVRDNNLYVADVGSGSERALTKDGTPDILNGVFDWVYEEEFGRADAWHWSPDGKRIAFWRLDQTRVKPFYLMNEMQPYNQLFPLKYPKAGDENALVQIGIVEVGSGQITWVDSGEDPDIYIPRICWTNNPTVLAIQRLNRRQNQLELLFADVTTGKTRVILVESDPCWVDVTDDLKFLKRTGQFLWTSERSGYRHIYLYEASGRLNSQLTRGNWEVRSIAGVDEERGEVYFYASKESPLVQDIYRVSLDGSTMEKISQRSGWHQANFSPDFIHYISFFSSVRMPTQTTLREAGGRLLRILENGDIPAMSEYEMVYPEFLKVKTDDGVVLNAYMIKPTNFDSTRKYPVLVFGYGGPGSQTVVNRWDDWRRFWHQLMTEKGYIIFSLDNRGTGGRGKAFKNLVYKDLSRWAVHDQIEGAKYLAHLPFVDASRIGFWGWSGGGYLTCMLLFRGADYFKTGVAVAPVTDLRNYDTIWTERYMGLPDENSEGYQAASVLNYAHQLRGKLLLIHGTGDDNVHVQNTLQLVNELIARDKAFNLMLYPNRNHRIRDGNTQLHLFRFITSYLVMNL